MFMAHDQIRITGIERLGFHGVFADEKRDGQVFRADVTLTVDTRAAAAPDDLARTVNYADVAQAVADELAGPSADLIETVAERIADRCLAFPGVEAAEVTVHKPQAPIPVPFSNVSLTITRTAPHARNLPLAVVQGREAIRPPKAPVVVAAILALGANLGDAQQTLQAVIADLDDTDGITVTDVSPLAHTASVGGPAGQPDYLNAVVAIETTLQPHALLAATQDIEAAHGRAREARWGPRTCDIDIITYADVTCDGADLTIPHPRAKERAFVLAPWAAMQPDAILPGPAGGPVAALAAAAPDAAGIRSLTDTWLSLPEGLTGDNVKASTESDPL
ncbi:MAG: 2-amino-4-hydroxy-6-hydroxymethyldihydropteridine diphosphokinase [Cellulomonadaceae bacterium]|jgi:dihydroneopterin aldolase/2-amino-4-hydroxy-6-hydroxymethyldihydropteridine diphosphokinase|nr:2-amino-4-hydroxy-6-hydroxymethyldihydropteridine diphosphokinase [Cellulomonadaceae bacterium]